MQRPVGAAKTIRLIDLFDRSRNALGVVVAFSDVLRLAVSNRIRGLKNYSIEKVISIVP